MDAAIPLFYKKVLADPRVSPFFENVNMDKQAAKQHAFLTMAFGGPNEYKGRNMRDAHRRLVNKMGLTDLHFDAILEILAITLKELNVPDDCIHDVATAASGLREDVLCRGEESESSFGDFFTLPTTFAFLAGAAVSAAIFLGRK